jgi:anthranilate phosphoribosyltransferase
MVSSRAFKVDSPEESKAVMLNVLNNIPGPAHDIVCLNAGAALYAADLASSIQEGITLATAAITSGAAKNKLELFVKTTQALALL